MKIHLLLPDGRFAFQACEKNSGRAGSSVLNDVTCERCRRMHADGTKLLHNLLNASKSGVEYGPDGPFES